MAALGADETMAVRVRVEAPGLGPEAAARQARYAALSQAAERRRGCRRVLLGHTRDDQAETVLLGLTRGSGGRSIAGMRRWYDEGPVRFVRPLLDVTRAQTEQACRAEGIEVVGGPAQRRPALHPVPAPPPGAAGARGGARPRGRRGAGPHRRAAPAGPRRPRGARRRPPTAVLRTADGALDAARLGAEHPALATRVLRTAALAAGAPAGRALRRCTSTPCSGWRDRPGQRRGPPPRAPHGLPRRGPAPLPADRRRCGRLTAVDATHVRGRPRRRPLHRGADPEPARASWPPRSRRDYEGEDLLLVGVLKGAVMVMADLARTFGRHVEMDWMAVSSYGSGTKSSGVVRILKDLDTDINGRHVLIVEDIIDTGLTLSWLVSNLNSRRAGLGARSAPCCASPTRSR